MISASFSLTSLRRKPINFPDRFGKSGPWTLRISGSPGTRRKRCVPFARISRSRPRSGPVKYVTIDSAIISRAGMRGCRLRRLLTLICQRSISSIIYAQSDADMNFFGYGPGQQEKLITTMEISETGMPEDRITALEKKVREMDALVRGLLEELLDFRAVAMAMTRQGEERSRMELKQGPVVLGTASPSGSDPSERFGKGSFRPARSRARTAGRSYCAGRGQRGFLINGPACLPPVDDALAALWAKNPRRSRVHRAARPHGIRRRVGGLPRLRLPSHQRRRGEHSLSEQPLRDDGPHERAAPGHVFLHDVPPGLPAPQPPLRSPRRAASTRETLPDPAHLGARQRAPGGWTGEMAPRDRIAQG